MTHFAYKHSPGPRHSSIQGSQFNEDATGIDQNPGHTVADTIVNRAVRPKASKALVSFLLLIAISLSSASLYARTISGTVFHDLNKNGQHDPGEPGLAGVMVSNGSDIVRTDSRGRYELPASDNQIVFVLKPSGFAVPTDANQLPQFYTILSRDGAGGTVYEGLAPTEHWPSSVDFPLVEQYESDQFRVVLFGDTQPRTIEEVHFIAHDTVQELIGVDAAFGVTLGDLVFDDLDLFDPLNEVVAQVGLPWKNILGNHDIDFSADTNWDARGTYFRTYGPSWYAFTHGQAHFLVLDNIRWIVEDDSRYYRTGLGDEQMAFVSNYLSHIPKDDLLVILTHIPWAGSTAWQSEQERDAFFDVIASHPRSVSFVAHTHRHYHHFIDSEEAWPGDTPHHMVSMGTVCGAWWTGAPDEYGIPHSMMSDGTPAGYAFLNIRGNSWDIEYKAARRPADFQMHLSAPDQTSASELNEGVAVYANVFNALPDARVTLHLSTYDNPIAMEIAAERDPVHQAMRNREHSLESVHWRRPGQSNANPRHLYSAVLPADLAPGTYTLTVRSEDRWHTHQGKRIIRVVP